MSFKWTHKGLKMDPKYHSSRPKMNLNWTKIVIKVVEKMTLKWTQIDLKSCPNGPKTVEIKVVSLLFYTPLFMLEIAQK